MDIRIKTPATIKVGEGFDLTVELLGGGDQLQYCTLKGTLYALAIENVIARVGHAITYRAVLFDGPVKPAQAEILRASCCTTQGTRLKGWKIVGLV